MLSWGDEFWCGNMDKELEACITDYVVDHLGQGYQSARLRRSGAGCINETWELYAKGQRSLFVKIGRKGFGTMYQREYEALIELRKAQKFHVPEPLITGLLEDECALLVMEFIPLTPVRRSSESMLGEALAEMHNIVNSEYGLTENNYIGRSIQCNGWSDNWWQFFCERRLSHQLGVAIESGIHQELASQIENIIQRVPGFFMSHQPTASLLHGDLWSGNVSTDSHGTPVIYDPALYYGDPETDIAMSQMFGALGLGVYEAYYGNISAVEGVELRRPLYDLYHWLNHFNLFGATYLGQINRVVKQLLHFMT